MTDFEEFWRAFPRKVGKPLCRAKFEAITTTGMTITIEGNKITLRETSENLIKAVKAFWMNHDEEKQFTPHPATWLNQGRFEDLEDEDRDRLAAEYDRLQERIQERKLRVV